MQIAIASTDGETVNQHFGMADRFFICDLTEKCPALLMVRSVTPLSTGDPNHPFDPERMATTVGGLKDCQRVYCARIGARPQEELEKAGITSVVGTGLIADITG